MKRRDNPPVEHDGNPIGQGHGFGKITGHQKNTGLFPGFNQQVPDFFGGGNIKPLGRLLRYNQSGPAKKFTGQHQFLQITTGKLAGQNMNIGGLDIKIVYDRSRFFFRAAPVQPWAVGKTFPGGQQKIIYKV